MVSLKDLKATVSQKLHLDLRDLRVVGTKVVRKLADIRQRVKMRQATVRGGT
jgi:hypothetical protein